jgi:tetratricopeptide (TPR) repeat protein
VQAINEKRFADAIALLEPSLRGAPGNARVAALLRLAEARMLAKAGRIDDAIEKYEEVLHLHPNHLAAQRDLAILRCLD